MKKDIYKKIIPIIATSFISWFYVVSYVPLGYMYNAFPGKDNIVVLIATLPSLAVMFASFLSGPMLNRLKPKTVTLIGLLLSVVAGLSVRFFGEHSLLLCVIASFIGGLPAGFVQAANYVSLQEIVPLDMRDKANGWADASCAIGMATATVLSGMLSKGGDWLNAYNLYWIAVIILIIAIIGYPNVTQTVREENADNETEKTGAKAVIPLAIIGVILLRFIGAWGYQGHLFFTSDFVVNESNFVSVQTYAVAEGLGQFLLGVTASVIFVLLRFFKGYSYSIGLLLCALSTFLFVFAQQAWLTYPLFIIFFMGMSMVFSGASTIISISCKGRALVLATSLSIAAAACGEFLSAYVDPLLARLIFGEMTARNALLASAIYSVVLAVVAIPIFKRGHKIAYADSNAGT